MNIKSKQIIEEVELFAGKFIDEVKNEDLNSITELSIRKFDVDGSVFDFYLEDLDLFHNLKKVSFTDMIIDIKTLNYINKSNIEELNLFNCELLCEINNTFDKIATLRVEFTDNFEEEYLTFFPNVTELSFRGYKVTKELPSKIKKLYLLNTNISDLNIIEKSNISELYISKEEYDRNKDFYKKLLYVYVYDNNNIYLISSGDKNA